MKMSQSAGNTPLALAQSAWENRDLFSAKWFCEQALALGGDAEHMARVHLTAGVVQREFGDLAMAEEHLTKLIRESHRFPLSWPLLEGYTLYNLGLTYRQRREYASAVANYYKAIAAFEREHMHRLTVMAHQNLSWVLCLVGDGDGALASLETATEILLRIDEDHEDREVYWQQRLGYAHCSLVDHGYCNVLEQTQDIIEAGEAKVDVLSQAMWLRGRALLALHRTDEAADVANQGLLWAAQTKDTRCVLDIADLLKRVREHTTQRATGA